MNDDIELVLRAQAGDEWAQEQLIETCSNRFASAPPEPRQDVRIAVWRAIRHFRVDGGSFTGFATKHAVGAVRDFHRRAAIRNSRETGVGGAEEFVMPNVETENFAERVRAIAEEKLTPNEQIIFFERILPEEGLTYRALGTRLGVSFVWARELTRELEARLPSIFAELRDAL